MSYIEKRMLPRYSFAASVLLRSVDVVLSDPEGRGGGIGDWDQLADSLKISAMMKWIYGTVMDPCIHFIRGEQDITMLNRLEALYVKRNIYALSAFISSHEKVQTFIQEMFEQDSIGPRVDFLELQKVLEYSQKEVGINCRARELFHRLLVCF